jgi:hypothetical protein
VYLFSLLVERKWFSSIDYSFINQISEEFYSSHVVNQNLSLADLSDIRSKQHILPIKLAEEADLEPHLIPTQFMRGAGSVAGSVYSDCAVNLVTETSLTEGVLITEKTAKPFMAYQIPIMLGPTGLCQFLQDAGLDMFDDFVPWHQWDTEHDQKKKIDLVVNFLDNILSRPDAEQHILATHEKFHPRLLKNKQYFHSQEFANLLSRQFEPK